MKKLNAKQRAIIFAHAFIGWALCGAMIGIGSQLTSMQNTIIIHDVGVPVLFMIITLVYFKKFHYTSPFYTAVLFCVFAVFMDVFVVSLLIRKSFEMFSSIIGTWVPLVSIVLSTYLTGIYVEKRQTARVTVEPQSKPAKRGHKRKRSRTLF